MSRTYKKGVRELFPVKLSGLGHSHPVHFREFSSPAAALAFVRAHPELRECVETRMTDSPDWTGLGDKQSAADLLTSGVSTLAMENFRKAQVALASESLLIGGRAIPAIAGGAWNIPAYLTGNPLCARTKPRTKLPHKNFDVSYRATATVNPASIARITALLTRAVWDYTLKGGSCSLTVSYIYGYTDPAPDGAQGMVIRIQIPLSSESAVSLGFSTVLYRGVFMGIASRLTSPVSGDPIPHRDDLRPTNTLRLTGKKSADLQTLRSAGLDIPADEPVSYFD
jgi:hypothetical protein